MITTKASAAASRGGQLGQSAGCFGCRCATESRHRQGERKPGKVYEVDDEVAAPGGMVGEPVRNSGTEPVLPDACDDHRDPQLLGPAVMGSFQHEALSCSST
ncbi:hypothetical protein HD596_008813 [Nonomuraea jabiensis]|uniref:Uncharacterized protein n=1 Tax=Nonomuraea jabiensis TaxID=882448 RepID=A0A7W9GDZ6_9ACTN|nr:hypothetical protein [Nonomuraea jabiensis]